MKRKAPTNDNDTPPTEAISFTDLAAGMGLDEDTLLQRLAGILNRRNTVPVNPPTPDGDIASG